MMFVQPWIPGLHKVHVHREKDLCHASAIAKVFYRVRFSTVSDVSLCIEGCFTFTLVSRGQWAVFEQRVDRQQLLLRSYQY